MRRCIVFAALLAASPSQASEKWYDFPASGVQIGQGWRAELGEPVHTVCLEPSRFKREETPSTDTKVTIGEVTGSTRLIENLNISTEAQANFIGVASAHAKLEYASSRDLQTDFLTFAFYAMADNMGARLALKEGINADATAASLNAAELLRIGELPALGAADVAFARRTASKMSLKPEYMKMWKRNRPQFLQHCGDGYVTVIRSSIEIVGSMRFDASSLTEKQAIRHAGGGSYFGVKGSSSIDIMVDKMTNTWKHSFEAMMTGGQGGLTPVDKESALTAIRDLRERAKQGGKPNRILVTSYGDLPDLNDPLDFGVNTPLIRVTRAYWRFATLQKRFARVEEAPNEYVLGWGLEIEDVRKARERIDGLMPKLRTRVADCYRFRNCTPGAGESVSEYELLLKLPLRKGTFAADEDLRQKIADAKHWVDFMNADRQNAMYGFGTIYCDRTGDAGSFHAWSHTAWRTNIWPRIQAMIDAKDAYPEALRAAMIEHRLREPARGYCMEPRMDPECIGQDEIERYAQTIKTHGRAFETGLRSSSPYTSGINGNKDGGEAVECGDVTVRSAKLRIDFE